MFRLKRGPGDILFSLWIRYRDKWTCQRCWSRFPERSGDLQNSHYWGRGGMSTRYDPDNCYAACGGCHQYLGANPSEHRDFMRRRLGQERFEALERRGRLPAKGVDDGMMALAYQALLKEDFRVHVDIRGKQVRGPALSGPGVEAA